MNKTDFTKFVQSCKGIMSSQAETLDNLCNQIEDGLAETLPAFSTITSIGAICEAYVGDDDPDIESLPHLSEDEIDHLLEIARGEKNMIQLNILNTVLCLSVVEDGDYINVNNYTSKTDLTQVTRVLRVNKEEHEITELSRTVRDVIRRKHRWYDVANSMANGRALPSALASIGHFMTSYGSDPSATVIEGARNLLAQYKNLSGATINEIMMVVTGGVSAMIDYIKNLYSQLHTSMSNDDPTKFFSSTDIDVQNFSCGMILTTISSVLTAVSIVLVGISRIAALIAATVGGITGLIGQMAIKYATNYDDTLFKWDGVDQAKCFKFVVAQGVWVCPWLARLMVQHNTVVCSIRSFETGSVIFAHLVNPDDGVNSTVAFEEHLSIDFDVFNQITYLADDARGNPVFSIRADNDGSWLTLLKDYNADLSSDPKSGHARFYLNSDKTVLHGNWCDFRKIGQACYDPISLTTIDKFKNAYSDEIKHLLGRRLISALYLWTYPKFIVSIPYSEETLTAGYYSIYSTPVSNSNGVNTYLNGVFALACRYLYTACARGRTGYEHFSNSEFDELLQGIVDCFDGIPLSQSTEPILCTCYHLTGEFDLTSNFSNPLPIKLAWLTASGVPLLRGMGSYGFCVPALGARNIYTAMRLPRDSEDPDLTEQSFASCWPTNLGVDLPKLKFSAFLTGLIIDAVVIVASVVVTIWAITSYMKLKRSAQRAALNAEAAEYKYTDAVNQGKSVSETDSLFKNYRRQNLKSTVLSFATGGLVGAVQPKNNSTSADLQQVITLIKG